MSVVVPELFERGDLVTGQRVDRDGPRDRVRPNLPKAAFPRARPADPLSDSQRASCPRFHQRPYRTVPHLEANFFRIAVLERWAPQRARVPCFLQPFEICVVTRGDLEDVRRQSFPCRRFSGQTGARPTAGPPAYSCMSVVLVIRAISSPLNAPGACWVECQSRCGPDTPFSRCWRRVIRAPI